MGKVVLGAKNKNILTILKKVFHENGFSVVDIAVDYSDCIRKVRTTKPDILVIEYGFSGGIIELIEVLSQEKICPVVILANESQKSQMESVIFKENNLNIFIYRPFNKWAFISYLNVVLKDWKNMRKLEEEVEKLKENLEVRKLVEKAKGIIMKHLKVDEEEAMKKLQKLSMDNRISLKEISIKVIEWNDKKKMG